MIEKLSLWLAVDSVASVMLSTKSLFVALYATEAVIESPGFTVMLLIVTEPAGYISYQA